MSHALPADPSSLPVATAVARFLARTRHTRSGSAHTQRAYAADLRDLAAFLQRRRLGLRDVSRSEASRYLAELSERAAPRTVKRRVSCIRSFYRFLRSIDAADANPFDALDLPSHDARSETHKVLSDDQFDALFDALRRDVDAARDAHRAARLSVDRARTFRRYFHAARRQAVFALAALGGLRAAEIRALPVSAFEQRAGGLTLSFIGKGRKRRVVPVADALTPALVAWLTARRDVPTSASEVFITLAGKPLAPNQLRRDARRLGDRLGVPFTLGPHALRRTFATRALAASGNLRGVADLLGHASVATTQVYTHVDEAGLRQVVDALHAPARLAA